MRAIPAQPTSKAKATRRFPAVGPEMADVPAYPLIELAKFNPWHLFGCGELALILGVSDDLITAVAGAKDTPFIGKKARPEWVIAWLQGHAGMVVK